MSLFDLGGGDADDSPVFDDRLADPRPRVRQVGTPARREGDARSLRERPSADGRRVACCAGYVECSIAELAELDDGSMRTVAGVVTGLKRKYTKRGDLMATFVLEDLARRDRGDGVPEDDAHSTASCSTPTRSS